MPLANLVRENRVSPGLKHEVIQHEPTSGGGLLGGIRVMSQRLGELFLLEPPFWQTTHLSGGAHLSSLSAIASILEAIGGAALLLDRARRVVAANEQGTKLVRAANLLTVGRSDQLKVKRPADNEAFEKALARVADGRAPAADALLRLCVTRPDATYLARLMAVREPKSHVLLLLQELAPVFIAPVTIQVGFALSAAEARLASALVAGRSLAEHAAESGVSRNTARNQLASIFSKTGTRRQTEVVAMMMVAQWNR